MFPISPELQLMLSWSHEVSVYVRMLGRKLPASCFWKEIAFTMPCCHWNYIMIIIDVSDENSLGELAVLLLLRILILILYSFPTRPSWESRRYNGAVTSSTSAFRRQEYICAAGVISSVRIRCRRDVTILLSHKKIFLSPSLARAALRCAIRT